MKLLVVHTRMVTLEFLRYPSFVVPTLLFPALFFAFFAIPRADEETADFMLASFVAFAFLGVAFFQFGVGISAERLSPWELFVRTLSVSPWQRVAGRVLSALGFASASAFVVAALALATTPVSLNMPQGMALAAALLVGSIPFALLGFAIGYLASPKAALPIANLLFLSLAYLGAMWTGPGSLPDGIRALSLALPTRQWMEILWAPLRETVPLLAVLGLLVWGTVFALVATWAYRRDDGQRFR